MKHDPADPNWIDRDRFVLSNGHASALLYGSLHLSGYDLPIASSKRSASGARTPPAIRSTARPPASKSPPARSARASAWPSAWPSPRSILARVYNRDGHTIVDHHTYVLCGDGDLMEGISHEACSLAGT